MDIEVLKKFCDAWISDGLTPEELESGEYDANDVTLYASFLKFEHAGRYMLKFGNQGFITEDFGERSYDNESDTVSCPFYDYITSTDVNYYDGQFETYSRPAYDVSFYRETFSESESFCEMSDLLGKFFEAVKMRNYQKMADKEFARHGLEFDETGKITIDGDMFGLILKVTIVPCNAYFKKNGIK